MYVWVVSNGEVDNGGQAVSVHRSERGAELRALAEPTFYAGPWIPVGESKDLRTWYNGVDYVEIRRLEVKR